MRQNLVRMPMEAEIGITMGSLRGPNRARSAFYGLGVHLEAPKLEHRDASGGRCPKPKSKEPQHSGDPNAESQIRSADTLAHRLFRPCLRARGVCLRRCAGSQGRFHRDAGAAVDGSSERLGRCRQARACRVRERLWFGEARTPGRCHTRHALRHRIGQQTVHRFSDSAPPAGGKALDRRSRLQIHPRTDSRKRCDGPSAPVTYVGIPGLLAAGLRDAHDAVGDHAPIHR